MPFPLALALALALGGGAAAGDAARPAFTRGEPFLWRVERGDATSHLFGTCHLPLDLERALGPTGVAALDGARRVFVEVDASSPMTVFEGIQTTLARAYMPDRSLKTMLAPTLWERLVALHRGVVDADTLEHLKPWAVGFMTYRRLAEKHRVRRVERGGLDRRRPILDAAVALRAKDRDIRVEALETVLQQVQIYNARLEDGLRILTDVLEHPDVSDESYAALDACVAYDERVLRKEVGRVLRRFPALGERLLDQRNRAWVERLRQWLPDGAMFVAVGVGHMFGEAGLVPLLRAQGYRVTRVRAAGA